ncbi:MAG: hypothetical protein JEY94_01850 [Melioribacteraceae bacterium]|nr:hypothetical protein [Melioribacteraceae bacterium]
MFFRYNKIILIIIIFIQVRVNHAQVVNIPIENNIYEFLSDLSVKGIIEFDDYVKPLSRIYVAEKLKEISGNIYKLSRVERANLIFFKEEFGLELEKIEQRKKSNDQHFHLFNQLLFFRLSFLQNRVKENQYKLSLNSSDTNPNKYLNEPLNQYKFWLNLLNPLVAIKNIKTISIFKNDEFERSRVVSIQDSDFLIRIQPNLGYREQNYLEHERVRWFGANIYAYLYNWLGMSLNFNWYDKREHLDISNHDRLSPETGIIPLEEEFGFEYSKVQTEISANWNWGKFSIGKDHVNIGYGKRGQLVLSSKAPSFLFARLDLKFTDWFKFNFFQGWLSSEVIDSGSVYKTQLKSKLYRELRSKYLITKSFIFNPLKGLEFSIGESVVFSDTYNVYYLLPFLVYKMADLENVRDNHNFGSNTQIFASISSRNHIPNTHLYGTLLIDELSVYGIEDEDVVRDQYGLTLGFEVVDFPIDDLKFSSEYTRINPFVYEHYIQTQTYKSADYLLGHWIGHNSELIYTSVAYNVLRSLKVKVWYQHISQGENGSANIQYNMPAQPFLFGLDTYYRYLGVDISYEAIHDFYLDLNYTDINIKKEIEGGQFQSKSNNGLSFSFRYGLK